MTASARLQTSSIVTVVSGANCVSVLRGQLHDFLRHARQRWYLYLPLFMIWTLAFVRVCVDPTPRLPLLFNWTASLPYRVALVRPHRELIERGDYIVFSFDGDAQHSYPGLRGQAFFKQVRGLPGDRVSVQGRAVFINGEPVGLAKNRAFDHRPLEVIEPVVIPPGHYYVQGSGVDSFDSRYRSSGLVRAEQLIASVVPLF